jgi:hypothetical protein
VFASLLLAAGVAGPVRPEAPSCPAAIALFRAVRAHTGGARWGTVRELVGEGRAFADGLDGRTRIATDLRSGATSTTDDSILDYERIVSSPAATWKQDLTRGVHRLDAPDARAAARTAAYLARNAYFHPDSDPAGFTCLPDVTEDGRTLRRIHITPRGGRPVTVWVDPAADLIVRSQEQAPLNLETTDYGAYRNTAGLMLPYEIVETDGTPADTVVRSIRTYRVQRVLDASDFRRPPDPANQRIAGGMASTRTPIDVSSGSIIVNAFVNGHGPLPFILDTGGHAILTADAAKELGIAGQGGGASGGGGEGTIAEQFARVRSLRIGDAELTDIPMFVIPYGKDFSDQGPGKPPLAGILGLEIFERFAVTVDYGGRMLTLQTPQSFTPRAGDVTVPLVFQDDMPLAYASADGARGLFGIDTGNSGPIYLFGDYLRHHGFFARYDAGAEGRSSGTGGAVRSSTHRLRDLSFGGLAMHNFVAGFVVQQKGSFSSRTEAGNIGHDVLAQFTLTTDYARGRMYLHRELGAPLPVFSRTGILGGARDAQGHPIIRAVMPGSPSADAGLAAGDVIVAIDGTPSEQLTLPRLIAMARLPVGTHIRFTVATGANQRDVTLTLRELLCNPGTPRCGPWVEATSVPR